MRPTRTMLQAAQLMMMPNMPMLSLDEVPRRGMPMRRSSKSSREAMLFHKDGFAPMSACAAHPAKALHACGWRTQSQLNKVRAKRERKARNA